LITQSFKNTFFFTLTILISSYYLIEYIFDIQLTYLIYFSLLITFLGFLFSLGKTNKSNFLWSILFILIFILVLVWELLMQHKNNIVTYSHQFSNVILYLFGFYFSIKAHKMNLDKFLNKNISSLAFSAINETSHVSSCVGLLFVLISEFFLLLCIFGILVFYQTEITIILSIIVGISSYIFVIFFKKKINLFAVTRREGEEENSKQVYEMFDGLMEIKSYGVISYFLDKYLNNFNQYLKNLKFSEVLPGLPKLWLEFISLITISILLTYMIGNDYSQAMIISTLGLYIGAVFRLMPSVNKIINAIQSIKYLEPIINNLLKDHESIKKNKFFIENNIKKIKMNSELDLKNISYGYDPKNLVLDNASFIVKKNQKIGISGQSGCGKSTLIKIIAGLIKPNKSQFIIDNKTNIRDDYLNLSGIALVPQNIFIINDTIKKNIAFGIEDQKIDKNKVNNCIKEVQLENMIKSINDGIDHKLLERGKNLSGGQIQRIGIARALYFNPDIIIFDESTSSLDQENEQKILKLIEKISYDKTIIFISHRKEVLNFCDITYHMENKKIYVQE